MSKIDEFLDKKYQLTKADYFDNLLAYLNKGYIERKVAAALKPIQYLSRNDQGVYTMHFICTFLNYKFDFVPGKDFYELKPDGDKVQAHIFFEDNKLIHTQTDKKGNSLKHVYEFYNDTMTITTTSKAFDYIVKRYHALINK